MPPHAASLSPPPSLAAEGCRLLQQAQERLLRMLDACAPLRDILREPRKPTEEEREVAHFLALLAAVAIGAHAALTAYAA